MTKKCIIYETLNEVKTMSVKQEGEFMKLSGVFGVCGVRNNNQRVYETKNYKSMIEEMKQRITTEGCPGELEHPSTMNITLENISHKINSIDIDENGLVTGEITLLNTPKGKIAQEIVRGGLPLFISSRAQGNVDKNGNVTLEMLKTYDLVGSPGFSQAKLHLNESQICESLSDKCFIIEEGEVGEESNVNNTRNNIDENMELQEAVSRIESLEEQIKFLQERNNIDIKSLADAIQGWIVEEYTLELADKIEKWIVEDYTPEVEKWVIEEYSPIVQNWIVEEYSQGVQGYIDEHILPEVDSKVSESVKVSKNSTLSSIDETLKLLESSVSQKTPYKRIVENADEPKFIAEMPEASRVKWNLATPEVKESITRRARVFNFVGENAIQNFWESVDWNITPAKSVYEGLETVQDNFERNIRATLRRNRKV